MADFVTYFFRCCRCYIFTMCIGIRTLMGAAEFKSEIPSIFFFYQYVQHFWNEDNRLVDAFDSVRQQREQISKKLYIDELYFGFCTMLVIRVYTTITIKNNVVGVYDSIYTIWVLYTKENNK